jgi:thiamine transporter
VRNERVRVIVEVALCVGLAAVLSVWKLPLPWLIAGGSVSLAMLPLVILALRRGVVAGVAAGLLYGAVDYMIEPWFVHPIQVLLDYGLAFAACGLAGLGAPSLHSLTSDDAAWKMSALTVGWTAVAFLGRFAAAVLSGVVFFAANAPEGEPVWLYSVAYNASYLIPSFIVTAALAAVIIPVLERSVPVVVRDAVS